MTNLSIRHIPETNPPLFVVGDDTSTTAEIAAPDLYHVEGRGEGLLSELQWYYEEFLDYPFGPNAQRAQRTLAALYKWGADAFQTVYGSPAGQIVLDEARLACYSELNVEIASEDPAILSWPWEAMRSDFGMLGHICQVGRTLLSTGHTDLQVSADGLNILMVISRPYVPDVDYRLIAGPLHNLIETHNLPVRLHVLRPPTSMNYAVSCRSSLAITNSFTLTATVPSRFPPHTLLHSRQSGAWYSRMRQEKRMSSRDRNWPAHWPARVSTASFSTHAAQRCCPKREAMHSPLSQLRSSKQTSPRLSQCLTR